MSDETELKLELTPAGADKIETSSLFPGQPACVEQISTYFDTQDSLLAKAGLSLRIRSSNGVRVQTVKGNGASAAGLFVRSEWECDVESDQPILDDSAPIRALLGERVRDIQPIFEVHVRRLIWNISEGETLIEVALDRGDVIAGDRKAPICELELELKRGEACAPFFWARKIDAIAPVRPGVLSKAERGRRLRGAIVNSFKAEAISLAPDLETEAGFRIIAGACLRQFQLNHALIGSQNPEALHQTRVALRRLRAALSIFKTVVADEDFPLIRDSVGWLAGALGKARNLDVLVTRETPPPLHDRLEVARTTAYLAVEEVLASSRARALMINLVEWTAIGRWSSDQGNRIARQQALDVFAPAALSRLRKRLKKAGNIERLEDEQRHAIRKDAKKLRYASEFFASLFGDKIGKRRYRRFVGALERLQSELGTLNDIATAPLVIKQIGLEDCPDAQLLLASGNKPDLLEAAAEAHGELLDAKPFWR